MTKTYQHETILSIQKLAESSLNLSEKSTLNPFPGNLKILADTDNDLRQLLDGFTILLDCYLKSFVYDTEPQVCQTCGSCEIVKNGTKAKPFKDLIGSYSIRIQRYLCNVCARTTCIDDKSMDELAFQFSGTSISLSKLAVVLYNGGCSLRYTSDVILASTGIFINKDTVRNQLMKFGNKIRKEYSNDLDRKKAKQVAIDEQYITIRSKDPNEQSAMIITVIDVEKNKIIQMRTEKAKQITELDVKFLIDEFDEPPEVIITDGAKAYKSGIRDFAPDSHHHGCLQHIAKNIRKKKGVKKAITEKAEEIIQQEIKTHRKYLKDTYKREVLKELTELLENQIIDKKTAWQEVVLTNEAIEERIIEMGYSEKKQKIRRKIHEAFIQRRLYAGIEAADYARLKELGLEEKVKQKTTAKVEGYHRTMRSRERRALCYRTVEFVETVAQINAEFYNYKRGHGVDEGPFNGFKSFKSFKIKLPNLQEEPSKRHITYRSEKYKQQRSHSLELPINDQMFTSVMQSIAIA